MAGIKEMNLPVATELNEGDMVRIVTGGGNSKQIDASAIGGGSAVVSETIETVGNDEIHTLNLTYNEMLGVIQRGGRLVMPYDDGSMIEYQESSTTPFEVYDYVQAGFNANGFYFQTPFSLGGNDMFYSATADGVMTYTTSK